MTKYIPSIENHCNEIYIPVNRLKKSPRNVRKTPHTNADIEALAASIAANGLLQNLVVEPELGRNGKETGHYLVTIGEGRRLAHQLLAKRKMIARDAGVRCVLDIEHNAHEISLAENVIRVAMHPADQFEAFSKLHTEQGMSAEDIATRFGVSTLVVRQRLALGAVSPGLIDVYRNGDMNLEQLTAFAVVNDYGLQERVWSELGYNKSRSAILRMLGEDKIMADDRRALFVGPEAYAAAGGTIIRDLFDDEGGGFFADAELVNRMTREKLQRVADEVAAEGWRWVSADIEYDYSVASDMRRVYPVDVELTQEQETRISELEAEYQQLSEGDDEGEVSEEAHGALQRIEAEIEALRGEPVYRPEDIERAGAFVCLAGDGELRIERGFVRREDMAANGNGQEDDPPARKAGGVSAISEKLIADLTSRRTAALSNELAKKPVTALAAVVHALAAGQFYEDVFEPSCLRITARMVSVRTHASGVGDSKAEQEIAVRHEKWGRRLPESQDALWGFVIALDDAERLELLAHCASLTLDAIRAPGQRAGTAREDHAARLATAVDLDMTTYWTANAESYLGRVSKDRILEAVREAVSADAATNMATMKKSAMAEAAESRLAGTGWLPELLRKPVEPASPDEDTMQQAA